MKPNILVIDDEEAICASIRFAFEDDYHMFTTTNPHKALGLIKAKKIDIVLLDLRLGHVSGLDILQSIKEKDASITVIMMTAYASIETSIEAIKKGAYYYIEKPINIEKLSVLLLRASQFKHLANRLEKLENKENQRAFLGSSKAMKTVFTMIDRLKDIDSSVLISGESGTGKELVARQIHFSGKRKNGPLEIVNCAAIPENLLESELFGYEKGAFTGATAAKDGKCVAANGGSLFLDEISEMPLALQAKLLRVIQEREVTPLGSNKRKTLDVRIISAANKNISEMVKEGTFREDLFFRLNVIPIQIPPLRERKEDLPLLIDYFLNKYCDEMGRERKLISANARKQLLNYHYPGNVRELGNMVEYAVALSMGEIIEETDLPQFVHHPADDPSLTTTTEEITMPLGLSMKEVEKRMIAATLKYCNEHRQKTAKILKISERSLRDKIKIYDI
ncbi:sigma-54-dependent transcriptional regulator [Cytobacillus horneckiae]|uniref:Sigma-54-dependent Fis family transcriptional regulator n=1 Tax=Cytobacillus horneckiae TaxID=549687 RepID=A0A2N0ZDQ2_9BACI|nr:sigma-54 dependent transcriptional regulator [Cytobacillus horneckiae]MEC1154501.1 sigma-54 dependent transcriptional regulator [Cytobacillus horneckiae]MED2937836.1 sigma-54 dependent transcriptional regulator [Cytobacillus horneckiae]PKG27629.1 sigma-54-dependent Fis family transcriptional regulator [Cytobacillus horneckiae]